MPKTNRLNPSFKSPIIWLIAGLVTAGFLAGAGYYFWLRPAPAGEVRLPTTTVQLSGVELRVEVADEPAERFRGLSGRSQLGDSQGMLFVFSEPGEPSFTMREMNFGLDIIWIGADKKVADISPNLSPESYPETFQPKSPVRYVLEAPAGFTQRHGVTEGDSVEFELN